MAFKKLKIGDFLKLSFGSFLLINSITFANADLNDKNRYALPATMVNIPVCQKEALRLHPGSIKGLRTLNQKGTFLFQIRITQKNGMDVLVFCDGETGNIIQGK